MENLKRLPGFPNAMPPNAPEKKALFFLMAMNHQCPLNPMMLVITFHPITFHGDKQINPGFFKFRNLRVRRLLEMISDLTKCKLNDINLIANSESNGLC